MPSVYWIHTSSQVNPSIDGYIGITSKDTIDQRKREHRSQLRKNKHHSVEMQTEVNTSGIDTLIFTHLGTCSLALAKRLENKLRPSPHIGWNTAIGGNAGFIHIRFDKNKASSRTKLLWKNSEYRSKVIKSHTGKVKSKHSREKLSKSLKEFYKNGSPLPVYLRGGANKAECKLLWKIADQISDLYFYGFGDREISRMFSFEKRNSTIMKICRLVKSGWNPVQDVGWLKFKRGCNDNKKSS